MPANLPMVNTNELRFVTRHIPDPQYGAFGIARSVRILQQRWVVVGTMFNAELTPENSEWRDVPLVEEVDATVAARRAQGLPDYEKPPLGRPPSWLQGQERKEPERYITPHPSGVQF